MNIKQGQRKPFPIEFVDVTAENMDAVAKWSGGVQGEDDGTKFIKLLDDNARNTRQAKAFVGDRVVHHLELGTFKSFSRRSFDKSYEEVRHVEHDRSAKTGRFVSHEEAVANPDTTVHETVDIQLEASGVELPRDADLS